MCRKDGSHRERSRDFAPPAQCCLLLITDVIGRRERTLFTVRERPCLAMQIECRVRAGGTPLHVHHTII